jgi:hypothetical protein
MTAEERQEMEELSERFRSSTALTSFEHALGDEGVRREIVGALAARLRNKPTANTWKEVADVFSSYFGHAAQDDLEPAAVVGLVALDPATNLQLVAQLVPDRPNLVAFLRTIIANHGPEILAAYEMFQESPDDWREIRPRVFYDVLRDQPFLEFRIEKYGGEVLFLEGDATSILKLTHSFVRALASVPTAEPFGPDAATAFVGEAEGLLSRLREQISTAATANGDPASPEAAPSAPSPS